MTTKVYTYDAKPPVDGAEVIASQISSAHRYYNRLIEIHRHAATRAEELRREHCPDLEHAEHMVETVLAELEEVRAAIRRRNAAAKTKTANAQDRDRVAEIKGRLAQAKASRKEARASLAGNIDLQTAIAEVWSAKSIAVKQARAECGVYFGTYLQIERAVESAVKKTKWPHLPRFRRWDGNGLAGAQIQCGMSVTDLYLGQDQRVRIERLKDRGKRAPLWLFWVRVASTDKGKPIWAKIPAYVHRPLPDDARIMWATIVRRQVAVRRKADGLWHPYYEWSVQLTIRTDEEQQPRATSGSCGVDLGWRLMADGSLRVAYWVGDDGRHGVLAIPCKLLRRWEKCRDLQSIRDKRFDAMRARLGDWLANNEHPGWLAAAAKFMGQWKAKGKLAQVLRLWSEQRFTGDEEMYAELAAWQAQDVHLWEWWTANAAKARKHRLHLYRTFAAELRRRYATIAVEDCDWRQLARTPSAERNAPANGINEYRLEASVGLLRQQLKMSGAVMVDSKDTTSTCYACGSVESWDRAELYHTCEQCGVNWDQDDNAARNLLARAKVVAETPGIARESEPSLEADDTSVTQKTGGAWARRKGGLSRKASGNAVRMQPGA